MFDILARSVSFAVPCAVSNHIQWNIPVGLDTLFLLYKCVCIFTDAGLKKRLAERCLFCCFESLCAVSRQSWFWSFLFHKFSNFTPPPPRSQDLKLRLNRACLLRTRTPTTPPRSRLSCRPRARSLWSGARRRSKWSLRNRWAKYLRVIFTTAFALNTPLGCHIFYSTPLLPIHHRSLTPQGRAHPRWNSVYGRVPHRSRHWRRHGQVPSRAEVQGLWLRIRMKTLLLGNWELGNECK